MYTIKIVGAGQLGSRHLQALKAVKYPLAIHVIDPSSTSLQVAKERYESIPMGQAHKISFSNTIEKTEQTDIAIIATNSNVRRAVLENLFDSSDIKFLLIEKLLFNNRDDYGAIGKQFEQSEVKAWVNCPMRVMPIYQQIKSNLVGAPISYRATGGQFGLVTNAIHYIDHAAHLSGCIDFTLDTSGLDSKIIPSKRSGFLELNGTLTAHFANGSRCEMTCYPSGAAPIIVEIFNDRNRYIVKESEGKLWHASENSKWVWVEQEAPIPYQSQITTGLVESLIETGKCGLTSYADAAQIHLQLLDPLLEFVKSQVPNTIEYPFT